MHIIYSGYDAEGKWFNAFEIGWGGALCLSGVGLAQRVELECCVSVQEDRGAPAARRAPRVRGR